MKRFLVLGGVAASLAVAGGTHSARPPALLTYSVAMQPGGNTGLCLARPDGTRRVRLTRGQDAGPSWSPGGRYVAFARQVATGRSQILVADARGRVVRRFGTAFSSDPAWSPDGRRIAYGAGTRIVVASSTGRTITEIQTGTLTSGPTWSPDGRRLAFSELQELERGQPAALRRIYVVNADGTGRRPLAGLASDPAWSRDGSKIAYVGYSFRFAETGYVMVANADGSEPRRLTTSREAESQPAWSPSGRLIAFVRGGTIFTARSSDGSSERVVVRSRSYSATDPAWRPHVVLARAARRACS